MDPRPIHRSQGRTSDRAGLPIVTRCGSRRSSGAGHDLQFQPERLPSLKAGGLDRRAGCAVLRRQSGAQDGRRSRAIDRQFGTTRQPSLGRSYESAAEFMNFVALERAGIGAGIAAQVAAQSFFVQGKFPPADLPHQVASKLSDGAEVVHVTASQIAGLDDQQHDERGFVIVQNPVGEIRYV